MEVLAEIAGLSTTGLIWKFCRQLNTTPKQYFIGLRMQQAKQLLAQEFCSCSLVKNVENLYILIHLFAGESEAVVEIRNYHKNITRIEKNGELLKILVGMDEGASYLGECALVPYSSPINKSGILFYMWNQMGFHNSVEVFHLLHGK